MTSFPYPLGSQVTFLLPTPAYLSRSDFPDPRTVGQNQIELIVQRLNFEAKGSSGTFLDRFGCRRYSNPGQISIVEDHLLGGDLRKGPLFKPKQIWSFQLFLFEPQAEKLDSMILIQKDQNRPIIIHDERIAMKEAGTRSRAKVGSIPNVPFTSAGINYYYMRSFIELNIEPDWLQPWDLSQPDGQRTYRAAFEGKELYTPRMIATRDDA